MTSQGNPRIVVRLPVEEIEALKGEADASGITLSELVRRRIMNCPPDWSAMAPVPEWHGDLRQEPITPVVFDENPVVRVLGRITP